MKMQRAKMLKAWSLHYEAPSQHAGCSIILIGTTNNLVTSSTLPYKSQRNESGRARWPGKVGGCGNLIVLGF